MAANDFYYYQSTIYKIDCIRNLRQLTCCLAALSGNVFDSFWRRRNLTKL